jgi:molybdate transport system substrate-binding protein
MLPYTVGDAMKLPSPSIYPVRWMLLTLAAWLGLTAPASARNPGPLVLAASSLQESLTDAARQWTAQGHAAPVLSFAATPALARQIMAGARADLFIAADDGWMDAVAAKGLIRGGSRVAFLSNQLVLIAPVASKLRVVIGPRFPLATLLGSGRLAMADPDSVPAGKYGKAALVRYGVWSAVEAKVVRAENVRAALVLVERGEAPLGIVYATDARASKRVRVVGRFPPASHPVIAYPIATLKSAGHREAEPFRRYLVSPAGKAIFARYGFTSR